MAPDAHSESFYLSFSYKSNSMAVQFARFLKMLIRKAEEIRKNGTATARQSDSNETLDMKSDTEEDAEKETKGGKRQAVQ